MKLILYGSIVIGGGARARAWSRIVHRFTDLLVFENIERGMLVVRENERANALL